MELLVNKGISLASPPPISFEELCLNTDPPSFFQIQIQIQIDTNIRNQIQIMEVLVKGEVRQFFFIGPKFLSAPN